MVLFVGLIFESCNGLASARFARGVPRANGFVFKVKWLARFVFRVESDT